MNPGRLPPHGYGQGPPPMYPGMGHQYPPQMMGGGSYGAPPMNMHRNDYGMYHAPPQPAQNSYSFLEPIIPTEKHESLAQNLLKGNRDMAAGDSGMFKTRSSDESMGSQR